MKLIRWVNNGSPTYGAVVGDTVHTLHGDPFGKVSVGPAVCTLRETRLLPPVQPTKVVGVAIYEVDLAGKEQRCLRAMAEVERNMDRSARALSAARASSAVLREAFRETSQRIATATDPGMLRNSGRMLDELYQRRSQYDLAKAIGIVEGIRTEWRNHRERLASQVQAAVTRKERAEIAGMLKRSGAREIEETDQTASGRLVGHCIEARF